MLPNFNGKKEKMYTVHFCSPPKKMSKISISLFTTILQFFPAKKIDFHFNYAVCLLHTKKAVCLQQTIMCTHRLSL